MTNIAHGNRESEIEHAEEACHGSRSTMLFAISDGRQGCGLDSRSQAAGTRLTSIPTVA
jgi:hypothetical protein